MAIGRNFTRIMAGVLTALAAVGGTACRSKIDAQVKSGPESAAISIDDGVEAPRRYFQGASVITLSLNQDQIQHGDRFTLFNETTNENLIEQQTLILDEQASLVGDGFALMQDGFDVQVRVYPRAKINVGKLVYGSNMLRLDIDAKDGPKYLEYEIVLRDFSMFGSGAALFSENLPSKSGLQGAFTGLVRPVVRGVDQSGKGYVLRSGFFHSVNH